MSEELFERYLKNDLDEGGARELSSILATEEGARAFSEFVREWTLLGEAARQRVAEAERRGTGKIRKRNAAANPVRATIGWAAGVAAAVLFMIALATPTRLPPPPPVARLEPPSPLPSELPPRSVPEPERPPILHRDPEPPPAPPPTPPAPPAPRVEPPPPVPPKPIEATLPERPRPTEPEKAVRPLIAHLRRAVGEVTIFSRGGRRRAAVDEGLAPDEGVDVTGPQSQAILEFPDATRIEVNSNSTVEHLAEKQGKRTFTLTRGSLAASVTKQPAGRSVAVFTAHAEVTVLGTQFLLVVAAESTKLEVREGRVRMTRVPDGASVDVAAHHTSIAAKGQKLESKPTVYTREFQDGAGYAGTRDTSISGADPSRVFGSAEVLEVDGDEVDGKKIYALLKWDLSDLQRGAVIRSAVVTLHVVNESQGKGYSFYELKRPWTEADTTWTQVAGLRSTNDRGAEPLGTVAPRVKGALPVLLTTSAEGVIQGWLRRPDANHGFLIANDANTDGFKFHSRESSRADLHPKLTLTYTLAK